MRILAKVISIYILFIAGLFLFQEKLLFFPTKQTQAQWEEFLKESNAQEIQNNKGFFLKSESDNKSLFIVFHGNAGTAEMRYFLAKQLSPYGNVAVYQYPKFSNRTDGKLTEEFLTKDALGFIEELKSTHNPENLVLVGESMGSGLASKLSSKVNSNTVILITPYHSLVELAYEKMKGIVPVRLLLKVKFENYKNLKDYQGRIKVLTVGNENVLGPNTGPQLLKELDGKIKVHVHLEDASHNTWYARLNEPQFKELFGQ